MLRINLLPAYVAQRRLTRNLVVGLSALLIVILVGMSSWYLAIHPQVAELTDAVAKANAAEAVVTNLNSEAAAATAAVVPIQQDLDFVKGPGGIEKYNLAYPTLYRTLARYTSPAILYNSTQISGDTMTISGYTPSIGDLGRYLELMYTEPDASAVSLTTAIPGPADAKPDTEETISLPAGIKGHLPGYKGIVYSYTVHNGHIVAVNDQGGANGTGAAAGFGAGGPRMGAPTGMAAMRQRGFGAGGFGGFGAGAGAGMGATGATGTFDAHKDGFPFTVELTLKSPPSPPAVPGEAAAATTTGGFGGPGGPGGYGGPGGPPPGMMGGARGMPNMGGPGPTGGPPAGFGGRPAAANGG